MFLHQLCTECTIEENTKYSGHNLYTRKGIKGGNMDACAALCFKDSKCKFWTFNPRSSLLPNLLLYLILCPGFANAGSRHLEWARQLPPRVLSLGKRLVELQVILSADSCAVNNGSIF